MIPQKHKQALIGLPVFNTWIILASDQSPLNND